MRENTCFKMANVMTARQVGIDCDALGDTQSILEPDHSQLDQVATAQFAVDGAVE